MEPEHASYHLLLERFDRKERHWLIRQCTGTRGALAEGFCSILGQTFDNPAPPTEIWWTTDYHLDWLVGVSRFRGGLLDETHEGGITGTIEDIDLIIAAPDCLYLIEAKAAGSWSNGQLARKVKRLGEICPGGRACNCVACYEYSGPVWTALLG